MESIWIPLTPLPIEKQAFWGDFFDLSRKPILGCILIDFGLTVGVLWGAFGSPLGPFGPILVALRLKLGSFFTFLVPLWLLGFHFGDFW